MRIERKSWKLATFAQMGPGVSQNRYKQVVETNKYRQDGCKCGSTLTSHENHKKVAGIDQNKKNGSN